MPPKIFLTIVNCFYVSMILNENTHAKKKKKKNVDNKQLAVCGDHTAVGALHHVLVCERELKNTVGTYGDSKDG